MTTQPLDRLLRQIGRLHPEDAAAVLSELSAAQRARVIALLGGTASDRDGTGRNAPALDGAGRDDEHALSPWLVGLTRADSPLTERARSALIGHIAAISANAGAHRAAHLTNIGGASLGKLMMLLRRWLAARVGA